MNTATLPTWASAILSSPPQRGGGLHSWLIRCCIALRRLGWGEHDMRQALEVATAGQALQPNEINEAIKNSPKYMTERGTVRATASTKWPAIDNQARQEVIDDSAGFDDSGLYESSPIKFTDAEARTNAIVDVLFPPNCLLCVGQRLNHAITAKRETLGDLSKYQFVVPSPMSKPIGKTKEGKDSARCLDNVGPRRHLVVEQDQGTPAEQAAIIAHLAHFAPLVLACRSGGKSIHAWFKCEGATLGMLMDFFGMAVRLGADHATWTPCQYVRMPDGLRRLSGNDTTRQSVLYFAPAVAGGATC